MRMSGRAGVSGLLLLHVDGRRLCANVGIKRLQRKVEGIGNEIACRHCDQIRALLKQTCAAPAAGLNTTTTPSPNRPHTRRHTHTRRQHSRAVHKFTLSRSHTPHSHQLPQLPHAATSLHLFACCTCISISFLHACRSFHVLVPAYALVLCHAAASNPSIGAAQYGLRAAHHPPSGVAACVRYA